MEKIFQRIEKKIGIPGLVTRIDEKLSNSELNSLLMELFKRRTARMQPSGLLAQFSQNRFSRPSAVDTMPFRAYETVCLSHAQQAGFTPMILSPLAPLGSCSVVALVDQHNIVSALRGTEAVSDATNILALVIAEAFKEDKRRVVRKYAATHRHVRGQFFTNPAFTAHFSVFCMATGGYDSGAYSFELTQLMDHLHVYITLLSKEFEKENLWVKFYLKEENALFSEKLKEVIKNLDPGVATVFEEKNSSTAYYQLVQFKLFLKHKGDEMNIADGGFVDWTQQLLQNSKQRLLISGAGIELIHKIKHGIL